MNYIKPLRPFYGFTQTVFPTVYDDSLSYYESINKMIYTFNQVIKDMNDNYEAIDEIFTDLVDKANEAINRAETAADAAEAAQAAAELAEAGSKAAQALAEAAQKKAEAAQAAAETAEDGAQTAETNAVAAQKAAEAAQALAEAARDAAKAAQTAAETARDQSKNYAQQSATSAADAAESAKDAEESANNAKNYSESAASSAAAASSSASAAENSANAALAAKTAAEAAQAAAKAAQAAAEAAQAAAETAEAGSKTAQAASEAAQKLSEAARDAAQAAQAAAETAKTTAETAATNAAASATAASQSATQAANSASAAAESASNADADATNAAESATHAANSATQAAASATDAADSAELAKEYADQAQVDIDAKLDDYLPLAGGVMSGTIVPPILDISNQMFFTLGNETRVANLFNKLNATNRGLSAGLIGNLNLDNTIKDVIGIKINDNITQKIYMVLNYDQNDSIWYDGKGYDFFPDYLMIKGNRVITNGDNPLGETGLINVSFKSNSGFEVSNDGMTYTLDDDRGFSLNNEDFYLKHSNINLSTGTEQNISKISLNSTTNDIKILSNGILLLASNANNDNVPSIELSNAGIFISSLSNSGDYNNVNIKASSINISTTRNAPIQLKGVAAPTTDNDAVNKAYVDNLLGGRYVLSNDDNFYYLYDAATSNVKIYSKTAVNSTRKISANTIGFNTYLIKSFKINPPENKYPTHEMSKIINQRYFGGAASVKAIEGGTRIRFDSTTNQIEFSSYVNVSSSITSNTDITVYLGAGTLLFDYIAI